MQFTTIASILAMTAAVIAAPTEIEARTGHGNPGGEGSGNGNSICSANNQQVCCSGLSCIVQVLSDNCQGNAYCCNTGAPTGALVNVALLNCLNLGGIL
ncbi:hypothetical protein F66182_8035 [Fusarium sp. NRRL 66182]|nr:hypothetical protein F66182_8035 [Fusarium sp. NRRL 66182]